MLDAAHSAALEQQVIHPVWVAWLDILNDPLRLTTSPYPITFSGTGDPDLDGHTFGALNDHQPVSVSDVQHRESGSDTVTVQLSGLIAIDNELLNLIGDVSNWRGRVARLWRVMLSPELQMIGKPAPYYTGYMAVPRIVGSAESQTIQLSIESYIASLTQASNRTYLSQAEYDAGDRSADASVAVANGTSGAALRGGGGGGGGAGGGGRGMLGIFEEHR